MAAYMASGARSRSPGHDTAPCSTDTCANTAGSASGAKTPDLDERSNSTISTVPSTPSRKRTRSRKPSSAIASATLHGMRGRISGTTEEVESCLAADSANIVPNPPSAPFDAPVPIQGQEPERVSEIHPPEPSASEYRSGLRAPHTTRESAAVGWSFQNI